MKKNLKTLVGAHMSISGGLDKSIERGESIGCTAIQIFTHSNRQWHIAPLNQGQREAFLEKQKNSFIETVIAHASYLLNIGSPNQATRNQSIKTLTKELDRCHELGIKSLVLHPGAHLTSSKEECLVTIAQSLDKALEEAEGSTMILLENMAGQGSVVGDTFEDLAAIRGLTHHKKRIGFCVDTCHAYAAGYHFSTPKTYVEFWEQIDALIGLEHVKAMHLNDSKTICGSHVDRHEHIGKGSLGLEPFKLIMNDARFRDIPKILETPKETDELQSDAKNLETLKELID